MIKDIFIAAAFAAMCASATAADDDEKKMDGIYDHINALMERGKGSPVKLKMHDAITTRANFKPPVEIIIEAKTDSTDLRMGYAANQVIFNWENNRSELRVDGGPADGQHKIGAGNIPPKRYVTIKWVVTPGKQSIYVDDKLRYEHEGDYSKIDNPISIFSHKSEVTVKTIKVKKLSL